MIKSGKKHTAQEKLRSLTLLDKCLITAKANGPYVTYFEKKIMERLTHMGRWAPKGYSNTDENNLSKRGAKLFLPDEPDEATAAKFQIQLLTSLRQWAEDFPSNPALEGGGGQHPVFAKVYQELIREGVTFPAKQGNRQSVRQVSHRQREARGGSNPREDHKTRSRNNAAADPAAGGLGKSATMANLGSGAAAIGAA